MTTAADQAYAAIRDLLADGQIMPGEKLSKAALSRRLGCSTVPVLEAMRRLESDGLIEKTPMKTATVRRLDNEQAHGLYLVREYLEALSAKLAAENITDRQADDLLKLADRFESEADTMDLREHQLLEHDIHLLIAQASGCDILTEELTRLTLLERTAMYIQPTREQAVAFRHVHRAVVQAIVDHDADQAEYLMRKHIRSGYEHFKQSQLNTTKPPTRNKPAKQTQPPTTNKKTR